MGERIKNIKPQSNYETVVISIYTKQIAYRSCLVNFKVPYDMYSYYCMCVYACHVIVLLFVIIQDLATYTRLTPNERDTQIKKFVKTVETNANVSKIELKYV